MMTQKERAPQECDRQTYIAPADARAEKTKAKTFVRNAVLLLMILAISVVGSIIMTAAPTEQTFETTGMTDQPTAQQAHMVIDINTADLETLALLPGVGEVVAQNIILFREAYGGFDAPEELRMVSGIGWDKFEEIKEMVTVGETENKNAEGEND